MPERTAAGNDPRLLLLDARDSVLVVASRIRAGEAFRLDGAAITAAVDLPLGHKVARRPIAAGEKVLKYGVPIGTATEAIPAGAHAHVHNIRSDYTPTYHLGAVREAGTA
jgi:altronate dehydratase small subunit